MNQDIIMQAKLECLKAALKFSTSFDNLVENYQRLNAELWNNN